MNIRIIAKLVFVPATLASFFVFTSCVSFGGGKPPAALLTLTARTLPAAGSAQSGNAKNAFIVLLPTVPRKLDTNRIPVQISDSSVAYVKDAIWTDKPARLMQLLLMETITAQNGTLVLNEIDAGGKAEHFVSGSLLEFGIDAQTSKAIIVYDAVKLTHGMAIEKRRFEAHQPVGVIDANEAGKALNTAANNVAIDIAKWLAN